MNWSKSERCTGDSTPSRLTRPLPELAQLLAGTLGAALAPAVDEHDGVHRAGAGAGDRLDREPPVLDQLVEHAPGEGAVRAAALQRERDRLLRLRTREPARRRGLPSRAPAHR